MSPKAVSPQCFHSTFVGTIHHQRRQSCPRIKVSFSITHFGDKKLNAPTQMFIPSGMGRVEYQEKAILFMSALG